MTITLYKPRTASERKSLDLISKALDHGLTLECLDNVVTAMQAKDTDAVLAKFRDAEPDPDLRSWYQSAINMRIGGAL